MTLLFAITLLLGQDSREALGPQDRPGSKAPNPLVQMMKDRRPSLRKELTGIHPRVFVTASEIAELRRKARGSHAALWKRALPGTDLYLPTPPAAPPAQA